MLNTKLILIDGISSSGKSTLCQWLELRLQAHQIQARWLFEADVPHPLHWWKYWDGEQYCPPDFDRFTPTEFIETSIAKWKAFAATVQSADDVWVVESALFLLGIGLLLQADAAQADLLAYGRHVQTIISGINPCLLYFRQNDIATHVRKICAIRGRDLEHELIANMERTPYFTRRGLQGLSGVAQLWSETQQLTDILFSEYSIPKQAFDTSEGNWADYRRDVLRFLALPAAEDETVVAIRDAAPLVGNYSYQQEGTSYTCEVVLDRGRLLIRSAHPQLVGFFFAGPSRELIPIAPHTFYAGILPVVITFSADTAGTIQEMRVDFTRLGGGGVRVWKRNY